MKQPVRVRISAAVGISIVVLLAVTVVLYLHDPPPPYVDAVEVEPNSLPGTVDTNAGKAYRMLWAELEAQSGEQGYNLEVVLRDDSALYLEHYDAIIRISHIEACDWGVEREMSALVPHVSEIRGFSHILNIRVEQLAAQGDISAATDGITAMVRLARHSATGFSLIEKITARKILVEAFELLDSMLVEHTLDESNAKRVLQELQPLDTSDPLASLDGLISDRDNCTKAFQQGYFAHKEIAQMFIGMNGGQVFGQAPSYRQCRRAAKPYREAMDILIDGWMADDYDRHVKMAISSIEPHRLARTMFLTYKSTNDEMRDLRERIHITVLTLVENFCTDD